MTLELTTLIRIDLGTSRSKLRGFIFYFYVFYGILIFFNTYLSVVIDLKSLG